MPKRMLDDALLTSASLAKCSPRAQDAFPRFILLADDFGCFEVIPRALAARGWVYRADVSEADMVPWLEEYVGAGMACLWTENERRYCYLTGWDGEHGQRRRAEYDPSAPKGTPGAHGSKRRTPRPPADLVAAVRAGLRRDRDGKPPGVGEFPGGNAAGTESFPGGFAPGEKPSKITPARESAGAALFPGGSAAPVPDPVPDPVPGAGGPGSAAAGKPPPLDPRAAGESARRAAEASLDALADLPSTLAVLRALHAAGKATAGPARDPRTRKRDEELIAATGAEAAAARVLAAWDPARPTLGWYADVIAGASSRPGPPSKRGMAPPSKDFTSPEATTL